MPARQDRQPLVDIRRRRRADGSVEEIPTVRYWDAAEKRRRLTCETTEEAEFECARMKLELSRGAVLAAAEAEPTAATLSSFWPTWLADASGRLAEQTLDDYEGTWGRRIEVRFGDVALGDITPRMPDSRPGGSCRSAVPRSSATSRGRTSGWVSRIGPRPW